MFIQLLVIGFEGKIFIDIGNLGKMRHEVLSKEMSTKNIDLLNKATNIRHNNILKSCRLAVLHPR